MVKVEVPERLIRLGKRRDPQRCPVALALAEAYLAARCYVGPGRVTFVRGKQVRRIRLPPAVDELNAMYDRGEEIIPFHFSFEPPEWDDSSDNDEVL